MEICGFQIIHGAGLASITAAGRLIRITVGFGSPVMSGPLRGLAGVPVVAIMVGLQWAPVIWLEEHMITLKTIGYL